MPRASWRGFLRLSLVSCPIYLSPATSRTKSIRLHQVWQPAPVDEDEDALSDRGEGREGSASSAPRPPADDVSPGGDQSPATTRVTLRPHDPGTGQEIDKQEVVKGYEYARGEFVTFTAEELKALDVESLKIIDLEKFVPGGGIDPVYLDSPYYVYPDGPIAVEALRVIGAAMAEAGLVGLGRLTLSRRERMVKVEPLIEAKMKGLTFKPRAVSTPSPVIDLMARDLAETKALFFALVGGARGPKVRRLFAGGRWIRTSGSACDAIAA